MPYHRYLRNQLSKAYDVFLDICHHIDQLVDQALGHDPQTHLSRLCPPCFSTVPGEPNLEFSVLVSMDGNNSLKQIGPATQGYDEIPDSRRMPLDRWLMPGEVDVFKHDAPGTTVRSNLWSSLFL